LSFGIKYVPLHDDNNDNKRKKATEGVFFNGLALKDAPKSMPFLVDAG